MKYGIALCIISLFLSCATVRQQTQAIHLPAWMKGDFIDDYSIRYTMTDTLFTLHTSAIYHIIEWNEKQQYILAKNGANNPTEKGQYTRIDYMQFTGMEPYNWGFCLTVYNAPDAVTARNATPANRTEPKKGCNGFPFSRMKRMPY